MSRFIAVLMLGVLSLVAHAGVPAPGDHERLEVLVEEALELSEDERADSEPVRQLSAMMHGLFPGVRITGLREAPVASLVELEINQAQYIYVTPDFRYLLAGELMEMRDSGPVSLVEEQREQGRSRLFAEHLDPESLITYAADDEKAEIYVFTDPSCPYCQRMHQQMSEYNNLGITVHYLAFPRDGGRGEITDELKTVWCAKNRNRAMDQAKLENRVTEPSSECDSPVLRHYEMGQQTGVSGTPAIYDMDGRQHGGYVAPSELASALGID